MVGDSPTPYQLRLVVTTVVAGVGLVIAGQAFRGYRRNDSRGMGYLAGGLALLTIVPFVLSVVVVVVGPWLGVEAVLQSVVFPLVSRVLELTGLVLLACSLRQS